MRGLRKSNGIQRFSFQLLLIVAALLLLDPFQLLDAAPPRRVVAPGWRQTGDDLLKRKNGARQIGDDVDL
jgi:hypothetical protein